MAQIPASGDNFTLLGPWRILKGRAWFEWRVAAAEAEIRAAERGGEHVAAHKHKRSLKALRLAGPTPVPRGGV